MAFKYAKNIETDEPIMLINKHIGNSEEDGMGVDGSLFQEELMALDSMGKKRIQVWINSVGGVVLDGYNIVSAINKTKTPVDTYCVGMAASIAGVIFQTGRKRVMADYGILMYHNPYVGSQTESPLLDTMKDSLNAIIAAKSGMNVDAVHRMMDRTSFIQADEAMELNLCDEIEHSVKLNTKYMPRVVNDGKRYWEAANRVLNKLFDNQIEIQMLKVTNKLQLNDNANEESIIKAIDEVVNRASIAEQALDVVNKKSKEDMDKMKNDMDDMENKMKAMKDEYEKCKAELDDVKDKAKEVEDAVKEKDAKELVEDAVKDGKIKNQASDISNWKTKAIEDMEGTKAMLDSIITNKKAVKFVVNSAASEAAAKYPSVGMAMAKLSMQIDEKIK